MGCQLPNSSDHCIYPGLCVCDGIQLMCPHLIPSHLDQIEFKVLPVRPDDATHSIASPHLLVLIRCSGVWNSFTHIAALQHIYVLVILPSVTVLSTAEPDTFGVQWCATTTPSHL